MNPLISVIIPTYNRAFCIKDAILSVLNQTYPNLEVIVVDDGSTDGTREIVKSLADERIRYFYEAMNRGPAAARNMGVKYAVGEYIAFQDSDDIWIPQKLEKQLELLANGYEMVFSNYCYEENGAIQYAFTDKEVVENIQNNAFEFLATGNVIGTPTICMIKQLFEKVGGFDEEVHSHEDWLFAIKVAKIAAIGCTEECLVHVNKNEGSVNDINFHAKAQVMALLKIYEATKSVALNNEHIWNWQIDTFSRWCTYLNTEEHERARDFLSDIWGLNAMMFRRFYGKDRMHDRLEYRNRMIEKLYDENAHILLENALGAVKDKKIAVYGIGIVGKLLIDKLCMANVNVEYIIDRKPIVHRGISAYSLDDLPAKVDMIILSVFDYGKIAYEVEKATGSKVVPLEDILCN